MVRLVSEGALERWEFLEWDFYRPFALPVAQHPYTNGAVWGYLSPF